ncbi:ComEC/Rec2 family competence protein [Turicibacter sanguinis]|uniref:ComEC/Rec2 family competence protein n=1 Tax=Turicibacter sanguinis TaxID=154288 RepID=UPI0029424888|nr:ComEC/Rec2 family competence protein [Turicibacter sanguinis]
MEHFLVEIDYVLELLNQAHWTDYLVITLMYLILILMMIGKWKKSKRQIWYNYLWLMLCPPVGIYLVSQNRKIKKKEKKQVITISVTGWAIILSSIFIYLGWMPKPQYQESLTQSHVGLEVRPSHQELQVHFIDIGQGDSTLIIYDDFHILIDGGNNGAEDILLNYLEAVGVDDLEIVVATHPDADHIGGLAEVLQTYSVDLIIDSGEAHTSQTYKAYLKQVEEQKQLGAQYLEDDDLVFELADGVTFEVIETGDDNGDRNNNSVVTKLTYNDVAFLFTGDMESDVEKKILSRDLDVDILKAGHHGSKTSSSMAFLEVVKPKTVVISAGKNNTYGHPHPVLLNRLKAYTEDIYVTADLGHIVITTDGQTYEVETVK